MAKIKYYAIENPNDSTKISVIGTDQVTQLENYKILGLAPLIDGEPIRKDELLKIQAGVPVVDIAAKATYDSQVQAWKDAAVQRQTQIDTLKVALQQVDNINNLTEMKVFLKKLIKYMGVIKLDA